MPKALPFRLFYSWQSDSPAKTNLNAIRDGLKLAKKDIESRRTGVKIVLDEATRDKSGAVNIAGTILEKIAIADMVLADVTTITPADARRACPNPNVNFELGYAVAEVGWERVVLLFNEAQGTFPDDLPFDFAQHRASPYMIAESTAKAAHKPLVKLLIVAIESVIDQNPKRPAELRGLTPERIRHDHDVKALRWLMSQLNIPRVDRYIEELPRQLDTQQLFFFERFRGVAANSLFHLYDTALLAEVHRFTSGWIAALSHDDRYHETPSGRYQVFTNPMDLPLEGQAQAAWDAIDQGRRDMRAGLDQILERIRRDYLEVDLRETNNIAWEAFRESEKADRKIDKQFKKARKKAKKGVPKRKAEVRTEASPKLKGRRQK